jgi:hypothetical protein
MLAGVLVEAEVVAFFGWALRVNGALFNLREGEV